MFKKGILTVLLVVTMIFAAGLASAADIDGLTDVGDLGGYQVYVNPGNLGDTLLYGYYNVRGFTNFFTIVNTSDSNGVVARIRFREAKNSDEVLDFNICLSRDDMFAGFIVDDGTQARLFQLADDTTLTNPVIPAAGVAFKHAGNGNPVATITADMTKEGYFELIGLTTLVAEPTTCPAITLAQGVADDVPNVLQGALFMAADDFGDMYAYRALALANFHLLGISTPGGLGTLFPTLAHGIDTILGVNWALTKTRVNAEYLLSVPSEGVTGETAYVITFPTKNVDSSKWEVVCTSGQPGARVDIDIFNENEETIETPEQFSPVQQIFSTLCNEVNVIELGNNTVSSDVLDSGVEISLSVENFGLGWVRLNLYNGVPQHSSINIGANAAALGLPSMAWWLQNAVGMSHGNEVTYSTDFSVIIP